MSQVFGKLALDLVSFESANMQNLLLTRRLHRRSLRLPTRRKKWIFVYYAVYGSGRGRCRDFLVLKCGGGVLNLQIWDLDRAHKTERTVFPILQVFSMCRANYDIKESIKDIQQTVQ